MGFTKASQHKSIKFSFVSKFCPLSLSTNKLIILAKHFKVVIQDNLREQNVGFLLNLYEIFSSCKYTAIPHLVL